MEGRARFSKPNVFLEHAHGAMSFFPHPSRALLVAGYGYPDFCVRVWDLERRCLLRTLSGHTEIVFGLDLDSSGTRLASCSHDGTVRLWDLESGDCLGTLAGPSDSEVIAVAWETGGRRLASGSADGAIRVWEAGSGDVRHELRDGSQQINALAARPGEDLFASGSDSESVRLWSFSSGTCLRTLDGHAGGVYSLAASHEWLVTGSGDARPTVRVWSWESGACARVFASPFVGGHLWLNSIVWRGSKLVAFEWAGAPAARFWDTSAAQATMWSDLGMLKTEESPFIGATLLSDGRFVFNAAEGLAAVEIETPREARARRRRLARAR